MIPFNRPYLTGKELANVSQAHANGQLAGDGPFTERCERWIEERLQTRRALLTHSCTAALEIAAILTELGPGDEVLMPSYTFVSTANAFVLRGARPVFVDINKDTLNIDEQLIEAAITQRTKAIVVVHYAGVSCEMDTICEVARKYGLVIIEDAAQAIMSKYRGKPLGSIGDLAALSFHETKNIISGEGGALLINNPKYLERAEIVREKGTNRSSFHRGETNRYTWCDIGSSYLPGEIIAAFLAAQLEKAEEITSHRVNIWQSYRHRFEHLESITEIKLPYLPKPETQNGHIFYLITKDSRQRAHLISELKTKGISAVFHYIPLHNSPFAKSMGIETQLPITEAISAQIVRLPLWVGVDAHLDTICDAVLEIASDMQ